MSENQMEIRNTIVNDHHVDIQGTIFKKQTFNNKNKFNRDHIQPFEKMAVSNTPNIKDIKYLNQWKLKHIFEYLGRR